MPKKNGVKEWLNRGYGIELEIRALETAGVTAEGREPPPGCFAAYIKGRVADLNKVLAETLLAIGAVDDPILRALLIERYVNFKHWMDVADALHYSEVHVKGKLHSRALEAVKRAYTSIRGDGI